MQLMNGASPTKDFVPLPGGMLAVYAASAPSGGFWYRHADWLGSSRLASNPNRTVLYDGAYAPFGEPYAQSGTTDLSYTGMNQDTSTGLYDFPAREYSTQGRWPKPDPTGLRAVVPSNPQTLNRYAYVSNNPMTLVDPLGLDDEDCGKSFDALAPRLGSGRHPRAADCDGGGGGDGGGGDGGVIDPPLDPNAGDPGGALPGMTLNFEGPSIDPSQAGSANFSDLGNSNISIWNFFTHPVSGTVLVPLVRFGPVASAGAGPTVAYNPKTDTGCLGLAVGVMVPAGGHAAAFGPLTVGNLGNADNILAGGSVFAGVQSPNPALGVQGMGNSSGLLAGATFGTMGAATGVSVSACQAASERSYSIGLSTQSCNAKE